MKHSTFSLTGILACVIQLSYAPSSAAAASHDAALHAADSRLVRVQYRECSQRIGPFVTQNTAWQKLQQAKNYGYAVSGVFPCNDGYGSRGYCFNVFAQC